jgi:hypothetical protein
LCGKGCFTTGSRSQYGQKVIQSLNSIFVAASTLN